MNLNRDTGEFREKVFKALLGMSLGQKASKEALRLAKKHAYKKKAKTIIKRWKTLKEER